MFSLNYVEEMQLKVFLIKDIHIKRELDNLLFLYDFCIEENVLSSIGGKQFHFHTQMSTSLGKKTNIHVRSRLFES